MFQETSEGVIISLHVQPQAPKSQIIGEYNNCLKIKIKAPPVDGKANDEIIRFFSEILHCSKNKIEILKGDKSKQKKILVRGFSLTDVQTLLKI
ncbi:MAG: UPF0235 protein [Oligoflexia bacterium]|nr:MAG: UPF0235 protein [Oligoflexia bacterium]